MKKFKLTIYSVILSCLGFLQIAPSYAQPVKIASWNIAWLSSHEYNKRTPHDYQELARYAKQLDADVIALQEVENEQWATKVFGEEYHYYFSTRDWVQRVGVAVKKSANIEVSDIEYRALNVGNVRYGMDITLVRNNKEIKLLAVHLKSGCFAKPLDIKSINAMPSDTKKAKKRKKACALLSQQIKPLNTWIDKQTVNNKAFLVLGDFNRRFSQDIALNYTKTSGLWQALNNSNPKALWTPTMALNSDCWGGYYKDYIDHIVFNPKAKASFIDGSFKQLVFDQKYTKKLSQNLSDHCPISIELSL